MCGQGLSPLKSHMLTGMPEMSKENKQKQKSPYFSRFFLLPLSLQAGGAASGSDAHPGSFVPAGSRVPSLSPAGGSPVTGNTRTYSN